MSRRRTGGFSRKQDIREEKKTLENRSLLNFNFKFLDETQPRNAPQSLAQWQEEKILIDLFTRLKQLSALTRDEAEKQQQIKIYGGFPPNTDFTHPPHVNNDVHWGVIKAVGGQKAVVAGFIEENTFYIVFLDKNHRFWITPKKRT